MTLKKCEICKKDYSNYSTHLKSKRHFKNSNKISIKITRQDLNNVNIKFILTELLEPDNIDLEYTKQQIQIILDFL